MSSRESSGSTSQNDDQNSTSSATATTTTNKTCKVIVIGAGMAGLSAANHLAKNGINDFKILEARNRIGGRIISIEMSQQKIELGANWIHGVLGNPIFELAMSNGLVNVINVPKPHKIIAATEDGKQVPFPILQEIYEAYVCFLRRCEEYFLCQYDPPPDINSVGDHINLESEIYLNDIDDVKEKHLRRLIFDCLLRRETCIAGCHNMNEIDLLELGSFQELQGGNIVLQSGYSSILSPICQHIPNELIIKSSPVKTIHWKRKKHNMPLSTLKTVQENVEQEQQQQQRDDGNDSDDSDKTITDDLDLENSTNNSSNSSKSSNNSSCDIVKVICNDGTVYTAEHVICTIPLGVLKEKHKELFNPPLPVYKQESIERLLFGTVDKIFLEYEKPFLNEGISEIMLLWEEDSDDDDDNDTDDDNSQSSNHTKNINDKLFMEKNWFKKIYSFSKINETLLLGWVSGKEAEYMETLSQEIVSDTCTNILRKFLKDPYVPKPKRCVCTSWNKQKYCRGSYTAIAVGASQEDIENIAQPLYSSSLQTKPSLLFAGEHTHTNFYSTVHGAYLSGRTAAQVIITSEAAHEIVMESESTDLSAWIQGIELE